MTEQEFIANVKHLMRTWNITQARLARSMHLSESSVSVMLAGKRHVHLDDIVAIAKFFKMPVSSLMGERDWRGTL